MIPVERQQLSLPSNGNVAGDLKHVELSACKKQAHAQLNRLRELIADISFHYSHVIRAAPRKAVRTRGHQNVRRIGHELVFHARIYSRCRTRLVQLGCDPETLRVFRVLTKTDLRASTAIVNPNITGSTSLRLSWLWHIRRWQRLGSVPGAGPVVAGGADEPSATGNCADADADADADFYDADPATLLEFKRVHWLRARAQKQRWREELILVAYEMQWTVRYFSRESSKWRSAVDTPTISAGAKAYAYRKHLFWHKLAVVADKASRQTCGTQYTSPLS
ncbi:hypothetical protein BDZ97DRAFT_1933982 [Flammula alnicola]|nr:hypothetical protein BDZ97DRAFT_1933982 [Flammula alnicola]